MHFGKIADMLWLSQVFENVNIADMLEIALVLKRIENLWYIADTFTSAFRAAILNITSIFSLSKL
jgi:hypothetical protein